ncbi:MAG: sensor histidine kinase [Bryobacteraceae bacterium]
MTAALSKRAVLRAGYAAVIVVLGLSAVEAYRIQISVSEQHLDIYRRYAGEEAQLSTLRRNLWLAGNDIRDFFIHCTSIHCTTDQAGVLQAQLAGLRREDARALAEMAPLPELNRKLDDFWAAAEPVPASMLHATSAQQFDFLQRTIVPKREELYSQLLNLAAAGQKRLQRQETEFAETRREAAGRLSALLALGVLLSFVVALLSIRHAENLEREAERHYAKVEQTKRELQQLSARLLEVEEDGRRKLSRELHDEIGQTLALLQIEISHAAGTPTPSPERLERARTLAERSVQTVRNISVMLRPALLDDLGLVPALQFLLEGFLRRSGIACEFTEQGVEDLLADSVKTCVYRVVQEALHNCEKHSGASKVRVSVRQFPDWLVAEVEDDGRGFRNGGERVPERNTGLGLLGMRERASIAGGSLMVDSAPGAGTRVALRIPLSGADRSNHAAGHAAGRAVPNEVVA